MTALKDAIEEYEVTNNIKLSDFDKKRFVDGWCSWENGSEYDIWDVGRKAREKAEIGDREQWAKVFVVIVEKHLRDLTRTHLI